MVGPTGGSHRVQCVNEEIKSFLGKVTFGLPWIYLAWYLSIRLRWILRKWLIKIVIKLLTRKKHVISCQLKIETHDDIFKMFYCKKMVDKIWWSCKKEKKATQSFRCLACRSLLYRSKFLTKFWIILIFFQYCFHFALFVNDLMR